MMRYCIAVVCVIVSVCGVLGCQSHDNGVSPTALPLGVVANGTPVMPGETVRLGNGAASLQFSLSVDGDADLATSVRADTASPTTAATVTITLITIQTGFSSRVGALPTATYSRDVPVIGGVASATFAGIDVNPALALVEISSGTVAGHVRFRGALDLATGSNRLTVVPRGSRFLRDVVAHVFEQMLQNRGVLERVDRQFVALVASGVTDLNRQTEGVFAAAATMMQRRLEFTGSSNNRPGAPTQVDLIADAGAARAMDSQVIHANPRLAIGAFNTIDTDAGDGIGHADFEIYDTATPTTDHLVWVSSVCATPSDSLTSIYTEVTPGSGTFRNAWLNHARIPGHRTPFWVRARFHDRRGGIGSWSPMIPRISDYGPATRWQKLYGGTGREAGNGIVATPDGGAVVGGSGDTIPDLTSGSTLGGAWLFKVSAGGSIVWQRTWGDSTNRGAAVSSVMAHGSGFAATCMVTSTTGDFSGFNATTDRACLLRVAQDGSDLGLVKLPFSSQYVSDLVQSADGNTYLVGDVSSSGLFGWVSAAGAPGFRPFATIPAGGTLGFAGVAAMENDSAAAHWTIVAGSERVLNGTYDRVYVQVLSLASTTAYGNKMTIDVPSNGKSVCRMNDGSYCVLAETTASSLSGFHGGTDLLVTNVKYDVNTNAITTVWQKVLGGNGPEWGNRVRATADGGCIVLGSTQSNHDATDTGPKGAILSEAGAVVTNRHLWVVKLDASGNIQWQKVLGGGAGNDGFGATAGDVCQLTDGGFMVTGNNSAGIWNPDGRNVPARDFDCWVVRLDP